MKQISKPFIFLGKAGAINLVLYLLMLPLNFLQLTIASLVKFLLFFFGIKTSIALASSGLFIKGTISQIGMFQTFFEILTLISLTLALKKRKFMITILPVIIYYVLLYSIAIFLFEKNIDATFITSFITYQTNYLIVFLLVLWFIINKTSVLEMFK